MEELSRKFGSHLLEHGCTMPSFRDWTIRLVGRQVGDALKYERY